MGTTVNKIKTQQEVVPFQKGICFQTEEVRKYYTKMLVSVMRWMAERFNRTPDYGWVDTKANLMTGEDFSDDDILRGRKTVYGWIQGRALEALTGHAIWLRQIPDTDDLAVSIDNMIRTVYGQLEKARSLNGGHLYFFMDTDGRAFIPEKDNNRKYLNKEEIASYNYSDLFCAKGMYAAAKFMNDEEKIRTSRQYCEQVINSLWSGNFVSDQYSFNGSICTDNIAQSLGPYMLCLNMVTNMLDGNEAYAADEGVKFLSHILDRHINASVNWGFGKQYDCIENVDADGWPLCHNGVVLSDPGHSLEFVGFVLKFLHKLGSLSLSRGYVSDISKLQSLLVEILIHNFSNGFIRNPGGICKRYDIVGRKVLDSYMPWWSLPETMRAVCYAINTSASTKRKDELMQIFVDCHNSFSQNFVRSDFHYTAVQAVGTDGKPMKIVPATPDADPGYHTGLSMIDCLELMSCD